MFGVNFKIFKRYRNFLQLGVKLLEVEMNTFSLFDDKKYKKDMENIIILFQDLLIGF